MKLEIPVSHFRHLNNLAIARREGVAETALYLLEKGLCSDNNWVDQDPRYNTQDKHETRVINFGDKTDINKMQLLRAIQALPVNIRAKTDGPIDGGFSFFEDEDGVQGITINGVSFLDPSKPGARDKAMFALLKDKFDSSMTLPEYRIFNVVNSQYLRLVKEPKLFTMPIREQVAVDAGAFVGYKAFAMAHHVGAEGHVLAFEIDEQNYELLKKNIKLNKMENSITPICCALSDRIEELTLYTQEQGTMGHSLTHFQGTGNPTASSIQNPSIRKVQTKLLGDELKKQGFNRVDCLHVSVNGHEAEVLNGLQEYCKNVGVYRVTCIFKKDGVLVEDKVKAYFEHNNIMIAGRSGGALVAGPLSHLL